MELDIKHIGREVRTLMVTEHLGQKQAGDRVAAQIVDGENGRLEQLYASGALTFLCVKAEAETLHTDPMMLEAGGGDHQRADHQDLSEAPVRTRYDAFWNDPLSVIVPVGNTGVRKPIGDLTREDIMVGHRFARAYSDTWARKAKNLKRLALKMQPGETLREAWPRLTQEERKLLP